MPILFALKREFGLNYGYEIDEIGRATIFLDNKSVASCVGLHEVKQYLNSVYDEYMTAHIRGEI